MKLLVYALVLTIPLSIAGGRSSPLAGRANSPTGRSSRSAWPARRSRSSSRASSSRSLIGVKLGWFHVVAKAPAGRRILTQLSYLTLPALALVIVYFGYIARMTRAGVIGALDADYTRTATMKGLSTRHR